MASPMTRILVNSKALGRPARRAQRGVVMAITLISLVILLIGVAAMLRSVDTAGLMAGSLAFRRDLSNYADQGVVIAKAQLVSGALTSESARQADLTSATVHYSASRLPNASGSTNGIPSILLDETAYAAKYGTPTVDPSSQILMRYVVDRQCVNPGPFGTDTCEYQSAQPDKGGTDHLTKPPGSTRPVYRISIRVTGPRNTEAFFQSIYAD